MNSADGRPGTIPPGGISPPTVDFRRLVLADEWLHAALVWLVPIVGILAVADATFLRFGLPPGVPAAHWLLTHAIFLCPALVFVASRLSFLSRLHRRFTTVPGSVVKVTRPRHRTGWYFHVTYGFEAGSFSRRFFVEAIDHYRALSGAPTVSLLLDPRNPQHSRLLVTVISPFAV